ncbi:hypothetical protein FACS1894139_19400 [Planctomycetales bacterium]|nr:hypothetical protein FACS1894107_14430 [Planctomycetales bacterium]GHS96841.1 hypothetical protein FACS1894108_02170 [Planctomycetales bacterium]GHT09275.1 hypothetical protein FACS1894139_19400 [Planctomycetales bacterium]
MVSGRQKARDERDKQERLAYVGTLTAGLVHDLRDPLHVIQLNAQMLVEALAREDLPSEKNARYQRTGRRILREIEALSKTLEMFLAFVRPPRLDVEPIDLNEFLRERLDFLQPEFDAAEIELICDLANDMYPVTIDQNQFGNVIFNLARNARESIEQRRAEGGEDFVGRVTVRTSEFPKRERPTQIEIADNGIGVKPDDEEKIFDLFYSTKEKGTGLGLNIVRRIVEEHYGVIYAATNRLEGARFVIELPRGYLLPPNE